MSLSKTKIDLLREFVDFTCESCHKHEDKVGRLEPHRVLPGNKNGEYTIRNILLCCHNCHEIFSSADRLAMGIQ